MLTDSLIGPALEPAPFEALLDSARIAGLEAAMPVAAADTVVAEQPPAPPAWLSGREGAPRHRSGGSDSGLLTIIALLLVVLALNAHHFRRIFGSFANELWSLRRRANVFDEHTANETSVMLLLLVGYIVCGGLLLYSAVSQLIPPDTSRIFATASSMMALMAGYYIFQLTAYSTVGYAFTDPVRSRQWLRGFNASQALCGAALLVPALITLFYPGAARPTLAVAAGLYLLARIIFIVKGFRIFYTQITSLLYFILYLCTLEIIPVLLVFRAAELIASPG